MATGPEGPHDRNRFRIEVAPRKPGDAAAHFNEALAVTVKDRRLRPSRERRRGALGRDVPRAVRQHARLGQELARRQGNPRHVPDRPHAFPAHLQRARVHPDPTVYGSRAEFGDRFGYPMGCNVQQQVVAGLDGRHPGDDGGLGEHPHHVPPRPPDGATPSGGGASPLGTSSSVASLSVERPPARTPARFRAVIRHRTSCVFPGDCAGRSRLPTAGNDARPGA
jgi:hypothetical protein